MPQFPENNPEVFETADRMLHGVNAFQLAARFHSDSLEHFMALGYKPDISLNKLASDSSTDILGHSALHMAACNPDPTCLRYEIS